MDPKVRSFLAAAGQSGALQEALRKAGRDASLGQIAKVAQEHGFSVSGDELGVVFTAKALSLEALDAEAAKGFAVIWG